ncbi:hypothetical protein CTI12_AA411470 [Artemisia annua]|uniref:Uncharacterized protein n=1 Tax=Artemisia annua TaxID=35608 RepID=A0A2U1M7I9_ARTAN|nr:hypothetical protein CTI12_AA411470 [Artemisia annua]
MATRPEVVYPESDDECDTIEGSLKDPNFSRLGRLDPVISKPLVDHDLSKERIKRLRDIYVGVGVPEVYIACGELQLLKEFAGLTKKGLHSRLEQDRQRYLQSYSIQTTNSG